MSLQEILKENASQFDGEISDNEILLIADHPEFIREVLELAKKYNLLKGDPSKVTSALLDHEKFRSFGTETGRVTTGIPTY